MSRFGGIKNLGRGSYRALHDFVRLFYPCPCMGCDAGLLGGEHWLCTACLRGLPETGYHRWQQNPLWQHFLGRLPLASAQAFLHFSKGSVTQKMLYALKYSRQPDLGLFLGRVYGKQLALEPPAEWDAIVPVPLHAVRMRRRSYNQSERFAAGLAAELHIPVVNSALVREHATETQTRKDRAHRWHNMQQAFELRHPQHVAGRRLLLVDDVVTTGATVEACARALKRAGAARVDVLALALVTHEALATA